MRRLLAPSRAATSSLSLSWMARPSLFWVCWIRNTIRKVTMVVPVLITSCHVSEKWNRGPVIPHTTIVPRAIAKAGTLPVNRVAADANPSKARAGALSCWAMNTLFLDHRYTGRLRWTRADNTLGGGLGLARVSRRGQG